MRPIYKPPDDRRLLRQPLMPSACVPSMCRSANQDRTLPHDTHRGAHRHLPPGSKGTQHAPTTSQHAQAASHPASCFMRLTPAEGHLLRASLQAHTNRTIPKPLSDGQKNRSDPGRHTNRARRPNKHGQPSTLARKPPATRSRCCCASAMLCQVRATKRARDLQFVSCSLPLRVRPERSMPNMLGPWSSPPQGCSSLARAHLI